MRLSIAVLTFVTLLAFAMPGAALAQNHDACSHDTTIASLKTCVEHAVNAGHIDNAGIAQSLLAKLNAAQKAVDRGQPSVGINNLNAFVQAVEAQSGKHIEASHAEHLITHAQNVITALNP